MKRVADWESEGSPDPKRMRSSDKDHAFRINGKTTQPGRSVQNWTRVDVSDLHVFGDDNVLLEIEGTVVQMNLSDNRKCDLARTPSGSMWISIFKADDNTVSHFNYGPPVEHYYEEPSVSILKVTSGHIVHAVSGDLDPGNSGPCKSIFGALGKPDPIEDRSDDYIFAQSISPDSDAPWTLFHLVTRNKRSETPTLERLKQALDALAERLTMDGIRVIHCTKLECYGHNSLNWNDVRSMLRAWANEHRIFLVVHAS